MKRTILFLAASPNEGGQSALEREARAIQKELESTGHRERFAFETRWAVEPLDLLRELRKLKPTVVHFTGRGGQSVAGGPPQPGLYLRGPGGSPQSVSTEAIAKTFGAAGSSVKLVVLNACYSDAQAQALLAHIDCVVGMSGSLHHDAACTFAIGFYGGLGEGESMTGAYEQGCAAIALQGLPCTDWPQLQVRAGANAAQLVLAEDSPATPSTASPAEGSSPGLPHARAPSGSGDLAAGARSGASRQAFLRTRPIPVAPSARDPAGPR